MISTTKKRWCLTVNDSQWKIWRYSMTPWPTPKTLSSWLPTDYYLLLLFHVGTSDTGRSNERTIKNYRIMGTMERDSGALVRIKKWLQDRCHRQGFGFLGRGTHFKKPGPLRADRVYVPAEGKIIFSYRLVKLGKKALNSCCQGKGMLISVLAATAQRQENE
mgnify:CR=1 FL=1